MDKADISALVAYNFWANERILRACERLSTEDFTRAVTPDPGWGSLRSILVHALDAEYGWRCALQAQDASTILNADDFPRIEDLTARWHVERANWLAYVDQLSTEALNAGYGPQPEDGLKVWQVIAHVVNHGTQHRSEAAAILTGCGHSPGELDFDLFLRDDTA